MRRTLFANFWYISVVVLIVTAAHGAARSSTFHGADLARRLESYRGCQITIGTDSPRYVQGQDIYLGYHIECDQPRDQPWDVLEVCMGIRLMKNGSKVCGHQAATGGTHFPMDTGIVFNDTCQYSMAYWDNCEEYRRTGFGYLSPGRYVGYFDCGVVSPDFEFAIDPIPDSLRWVWDEYSRMRRAELLPNHRYVQADQDTIIAILRNFMARPVGSLWRKEALRTGVGACHFISTLFETAYSAIEDSALTLLAQEPGQPAWAVAALVSNTVCNRQGWTKAEHAAALRVYAARVPNSAVAEKLLKAAADGEKAARRRNER